MRDYKSFIGQILTGFSADTKSSYRALLNQKAHLIPIDLDNLWNTLAVIGPDKIPAFRAELLDEIDRSLNIKVRLNIAQFNSLTYNAKEFHEFLGKSSLLILDEAGNPGALVFPSYSRATSSLIEPIVNKLLSKYSKSGFDLGHLVSSDPAAKTPLQLKLEEVQGILGLYGSGASLEKLADFAADKALPIVVNAMNGRSAQSTKTANYFLYDKIPASGEIPTYFLDSQGNIDPARVRTNILHLFKSRIRLRASGDYKKGTNSAGSIRLLSILQTKLNEVNRKLKSQSPLGEIVLESRLVKELTPAISRLNLVITIIQDREENRKVYASTIESRLESEFRNEVLKTILTSEHFSPGFNDDIGDGIVEVILFGKKGRSTKAVKTVKHKNAAKLEKQKIVALTRNTQGVSGKTGLAAPKFSQLRDNRGRFTSLIKIQDLINTKLHDVIKKYMVFPRLVYRTGRFASSASVTSIERTSAGLKAYYTYQKYPYQTFEPGYAMGDTERDPRKLIAKSIREIARDLVTEKLYKVIRE